VKLDTVESVLKRVSVNPDLSGAVSSAEAALDAATVLLANMLEATFEYTAVTEYYSPSDSKLNTSVNLYLSRMLLAVDEKVSISANDGTGVFTEVDALTYSVDRIYGIVSLDNLSAVGRRAIQIKYVSGFEGETDERIPSWLNEAAITAAVYIMHTQVAAHGKQDILDISPEYRRLVYVMIQQYLRPRMNSLFVDVSEYELL